MYSPVTADSGLRNRLQLALSMMNVERDIQIQVSKRKVATQIYNFWHPTILLSESAISENTADEVDTIVLHEIAHYKDKDIIAVEISRAVIIALVIQFLISLALLVSIALSLFDIVNNNPKMLLLSGTIKTTVELIVNTILVNLAVPFVLFVFVVAITLQTINYAYRERRADIWSASCLVLQYFDKDRS
jgi:Zn-dependent protease with chaperone function